MVALLLLLVGVGVGAWSQEVHRDTMVGNIWLEWIRKPTRLVPDTSPIRIVPLGGNDKVWMWPSKLSWLSSERLAVVHPLRYGVVAELYDTAARAQVAGLYYFFLMMGGVKNGMHRSCGDSAPEVLVYGALAFGEY